MTHRYHGKGGDTCTSVECSICDGGLLWCTVCGGAERSLPQGCPGRKMTAEEEHEVYAGTLDYHGGTWHGNAPRAGP